MIHNNNNTGLPEEELPYRESVIRYQGIAHDIAMLSDEDSTLFLLALCKLAKEPEEEEKP